MQAKSQRSRHGMVSQYISRSQSVIGAAVAGPFVGLELRVDRDQLGGQLAGEVRCRRRTPRWRRPGSAAAWVPTAGTSSAGLVRRRPGPACGVEAVLHGGDAAAVWDRYGLTAGVRHAVLHAARSRRCGPVQVLLSRPQLAVVGANWPASQNRL